MMNIQQNAIILLLSEAKTWYINIKKRKPNDTRAMVVKWSSWNKDRAFSRLYIQCDRRAG
jgi:hypothetical protein